MNGKWNSTVVLEVCGAVYVPAGGGKKVHKDRAYHGFVLNDEGAIKDYCFSDGRVMRTEGGCLFYLPKGSSYFVKDVQIGGCHAINFEADIADEPFSIKPRGYDKLHRSFKVACDEWMKQSPSRVSAAMIALYESMHRQQESPGEQYIGKDAERKILRAVAELDTRFAENEISVSYLSELCGVSEVYFRKIFEKKMGVSPKEYIILRRMEYARQLLASGQVGVAETAQMCGYSEPCHFSREFKKRFGVAPKDYK